MDLILKTAPDDLFTLPLAEAKNYCNVDFTDSVNDSVITDLISSAREYVEAETNISIGEQTWILALDGFPVKQREKSDPDGERAFMFNGSTREPIEIPKPPLGSVVSLKYIDAGGVQTLIAADKYRVLLAGKERSRIVPLGGEAWPVAQEVEQAVEVEFTCGFVRGGTGARKLPSMILTAMKIAVEDLYSNRGGGVVSEDTAKTIRRYLSTYWTHRYGYHL